MTPPPTFIGAGAGVGLAIGTGSGMANVIRAKAHAIPMIAANLMVL
jgi:hypothetical protein